MMSKNYSGWHVLYVKSQHEKKVDSILKDLELDSFVPTTTTIRQWADRKKKVIKPLFPSYVFLNVRSKADFYKPLALKEVFKYITFGKDIATIKEAEINRIKHFLNIEGISEVDSVNYVPFKGELVIIDYGPLSGLKCEVLTTNNINKVLVRIESLRQNITAVIPSNFLSKLKPENPG